MIVVGVQNMCQVHGLPITVSDESLSSWTRDILDEMSVQSMSIFRPALFVQNVCVVLKSTSNID
jgi:hypothetical protein